MNIDLSGKTAVVSGSTGGIGLAIAKGLAGSGAHVVVNGRSEKRVKDAVAAVRQAAPGAHVAGIACDLATAEGADKLTARAAEADILVNKMGIFEPNPFG